MFTAATPTDIRIFATIAEHGSFATAARRLLIPTTTVSRKIEALEARLGVRLIQRSTRKVVLTEAGEVFYAHCGAILARIEEAESAIGHLTTAVHGSLRVTTPYSFAVMALAPVLPAFLARHPEVHIDLTVRNDPVDLIAENFDVAVAVSHLPDSGLVSRRLNTRRSVLVAGPAYLQVAGVPGSVAELAQHRTLTHVQHGRFNGSHGWLLQREAAAAAGRTVRPADPWGRRRGPARAGGATSLNRTLFCHVQEDSRRPRERAR